MYRIGEFSRVCRVSVKTLRYYDDLGLLTPDFIDESSGYRYYNPSKLQDFNKIAALKAMNFSLDEIKEYFKNINSPSIIEVIDKKKKELYTAFTQIQLQLNMLDSLSKIINGEGEGMNCNVVISENRDIKLATIRALAKDRTEINDTLNKIKQFIVNNNVKYEDKYVVINHDIEYCNKNLDLEIGTEITGQLPESDFIREKIIAGGRSTACAVCNNNSEDIEMAYSAILRYTSSNMYQIIGSYCEIYHDKDTVEIRVPVHKKSERTAPRNDDIKVPFENDEEVIGKWELIDVLPSKEQFCVDKRKYKGGLWFKEIYFLPNGTPYWVFGWTKGLLIHTTGDPSSTLNEYTIENIHGQKYMFINMKLRDYMYYNGKAEVAVLKQVDNKQYNRENVRIYDKLDYPFIPDDDVLGRWKVIGYTSTISNFNPYKYNESDGYWIKSLEFKENGNLLQEYSRGISVSPIVTWTKGRIMNKSSDTSTSPAYEIRRIDGCDYLFMECKNGDYIYGKMKPNYFVFRRDESQVLEGEVIDIRDANIIKKLALQKDIQERMKCMETDKRELAKLINLLLRMVDSARQKGYNSFNDFKGDNEFLNKVIDAIIQHSPIEMMGVMLPELINSDLKGKEFAERFIILDALYSVAYFGWSSKLVEEFINSYLQFATV